MYDIDSLFKKLKNLKYNEKFLKFNEKLVELMFQK